MKKIWRKRLCARVILWKCFWKKRVRRRRVSIRGRTSGCNNGNILLYKIPWCITLHAPYHKESLRSYDNRIGSCMKWHKCRHAFVNTYCPLIRGYERDCVRGVDKGRWKGVGEGGGEGDDKKCEKVSLLKLISVWKCEFRCGVVRRVVWGAEPASHASSGVVGGGEGGTLDFLYLTGRGKLHIINPTRLPPPTGPIIFNETQYSLRVLLRGGDKKNLICAFIYKREFLYVFIQSPHKWKWFHTETDKAFKLKVLLSKNELIRTYILYTFLLCWPLWYTEHVCTVCKKFMRLRLYCTLDIRICGMLLNKSY